MEKCFYSATVSLTVLLLVLIQTTPTAFAAPGQVTIVHGSATVSLEKSSGRCRARCGSGFHQHFRGNTYSHLPFTFHGKNLNNSGNSGNNFGRNVNYGSNGGNLMINHGKSRSSSIHQSRAGNSYSWDRVKGLGRNISNSGNQGRNRGSSMNYGGNGGNLIINQAKPGQDVRVSQGFSGNSYSHSKATFVGSNQNNTGNQGSNHGYNEDHGGNAGNQIVN